MTDLNLEPLMNFASAWSTASFVQDTKIIEITPDIAKELLEKNFNNRTVKPNLVIKIINDILKGRWRTTHQPIAIDVEGNLIDGQHRLNAIIKSGKSVRVRVTRDCVAETMSVVDIGKSRTNADMLHMNNHKNSKDLAAIAKQIYCYKNYPNSFWQDRKIIVTSLDLEQVLLDLQSRNIDYQAAISHTKSLMRKFKLLTKSVGATFILLCELDQIHQSLYANFLDTFVAGENLERNSPIYFLRNRWINATKNLYPHSTASQIKLAELITVYKLYTACKTITRMPPVSISPMPSLSNHE